jgi:ankyrin repeat protein
VSTSSPLPASLEQQHKRAKDLLRAAREGDAPALARIRTIRRDAGMPARPLKLSDAQLAIAREAGFTSWPALVSACRERDVEAFRDAVTSGDTGRARQLLAASHVRARINDSMFPFGQRAAHVAAEKGEAMLAALLEAGADPDSKSDWHNGPFTVLDRADEPTAQFLLSRGATLTPHVAARLGWIDDVRRLLDADPSLVDARGGDARQPLHEAKTVAIADLLLDRGADINTRCVDHRATAAQYALVDRPDVCRRLLERGATPDIFMAAHLGDADLATRVFERDPDCLSARINEPGYEPVPPLHIYCWTLGFGLSPHEVARRAGHRDVRDLLLARSPAPVRLIEAALAGDEPAVQEVLRVEPSVVASLTEREHRHLAFAIFHGRYAAARILLRLGFDPAAPGADGGSALHAACWVGHADLVGRILETGRVPVDSRDPTHGSTPLGWAAFGSAQRRAAGGDYAGVIERLAAAGADVTAPGNRAGRTLVEMAHGNPEVQATLRRLGAR